MGPVMTGGDATPPAKKKVNDLVRANNMTPPIPRANEKGFGRRNQFFKGFNFG
jgi:hypothetical protein